MTLRNKSPILVLDDEPYVLKILAHMLAAQGCTRVVTCTSGSEALRRIDDLATRPGLILCDLNMPEMDGVEFVRQLVERGYRGSMILVSGESERVLQAAEKLVRARDITVVGSLTKPVAPGALALLLKRWVPDVGRETRAAIKVYRDDELAAGMARGELLNYYQPKVSVVTGELVGVESLVRWRHPRDGMVFPDHFIGVAEEHGLIDQLTRLVLAAALAQVHAWQRSGLALQVALNISMESLGALDFPDFVAAQAAVAGVLPQSVVLEVTESRLMKDPRASLDVLTRLRLKGFCLSIDDFGTGHSSLVQLRDIPFQELKLAPSFVHGVASDKTVRAMYNASLGLAKQLAMDVVAEGVEDRQDWDFVRRSQCDCAQGYFIAKPMPAAEVPLWAKNWRSRMQRELPARHSGDRVTQP